jgi:hypothetical protein
MACSKGPIIGIAGPSQLKGVQRLEQAEAALGLTDFVDPRHLDGFEDFFPGMLGVVFEIRQFHHPGVQVSEADGARVDLGVCFGEFDSDV